MEPFINALNQLPAVFRPFALPLGGLIVTLMGLMAMISIGNQSLRATVKEHFVWLLLGGILVFSGVAMVGGLFGQLGLG